MVRRLAQAITLAFLLAGPVLAQQVLDQSPAKSTLIDSVSASHSYTKDVLISSLFGTGGALLGFLAPDKNNIAGAVALSGLNLGSILGTAVAHRDPHVYPVQAVTTVIGMFAGFLAAGIVGIGCIASECSNTDMLGLYAIAITGPAIGSTVGYHWGKVLADQQSYQTEP